MTTNTWRNTCSGKPAEGNSTFSISSTVPAYHPILDRRNRAHRKKRRGASAVEFAVVAPLFILLVFGMIEFGRMVMVQQVLTNASREGARLAVLEGSSVSAVTTEVEDYLSSSAISGAAVAVDPSPLDSAGYGDPVSVTVTVGFDQVTWLPTPMFLSGTNLTATTVMRRESVQ